jgi:hypothetical protein
VTALTPVRITLRLHRFEVVAFALLAALALAAALYVVARLDAVGYGADCIEANRTGALTPPGCEFKINTFYEIVSSQAGIVSTLITIVPFVAAVLLGVAVVGREIERGTIRLAWALSPSRQRWFLQRFVPVLLVVAGTTYVLGIAADRLLASTEPGLDPTSAFAQFGFRGVVLAARVVFVLTLAVLVGAIMGRALPALIVGGILAAVAIVGGIEVHSRILRSEAVIVPDPETQVGALYFEERFRLPDGRLIGWDEVELYDPAPTDPEFAGQWPTLPRVILGIPGSRYREVELREVGALAGGTLVALLGTTIVIRRRRPG